VEQRRYLRCLGQPALFSATGEPVRFRTKKHLALLLYMAVDGRSHRRDRLAEILWPKVSPTEARHSLATALSTLRPRLGPDALESGRDHVHLMPGCLTLDLERLEAGNVLGNEVTGALEVAPFLDGFDIPDSAEFSHWKDRQQARLLPMIKDALVLLIDHCRRTGDTREIERLADRMLALDELCEEAIRAKMEARAFAGDRLTALEVFEAWKAKLAEELQAAPSELVEGMAVRLRRRGWERATLPKIPNVPTDQWRGRPFIGRTSEYRLLYEAWEEVCLGTPQSVLVLGDSGVGKSTLVERLTTAAGLQGASIGRVQCYDLEREIPFSTLNSLVLCLLDRSGVSATSPDALSELSQTVPEIRRRFPNIPVSTASQGETARIRFTEAFQEMLIAVSEEHPVILVVDDLHLADDISLAVLHLILRRVAMRNILVILIARTGELIQSPQAARLREGSAALAMREVHLQPLSEEESEQMLTSLLPSDQPSPGVAAKRALVRAGAGYPMVLELLVHDWQSNGEDSLALSISAMTKAPGSEGDTHLPYRQILERMTRSLDVTTRNVLNLASLLGQRLNDLAMYTVVDLRIGQTMSGMAELVRRRVLRDAPQGLEFVNEVVRASAYLGVPTSLRRVLHGKIADLFIQEHASGIPHLELEIAWHCIRAGRNAEATPHLLRGARDSIRAGVPYGAERGLTTALPDLEGTDKTEALAILAEALQEQGKWSESSNVIANIENSPRTRRTADLAFILGIRARWRLPYRDSMEIAELPGKLLLFIESAEDKAVQIRAAAEAASILNAIHRTDEASPILARLPSLDDGTLETDDRIRLLLAQSMLSYNVRDLTTSLRHIKEGTALLQARNSTSSLLAMMYLGEGSVYMVQGAYAASVPSLLRAYETALRIDNPTIYLQASINLSISFSRLGEYDQAVRWANQVLSSDVPKEAVPGYLQAAKSAIIAHSMLGQKTIAAGIIEQCCSTTAKLDPSMRHAWAFYVADAYAMMGRDHEAEQQGRSAVESNNDLDMDFCAGPYARWLARSYEAAGNTGRQNYDKLDRLTAKIPRLDALDQLEVLNSRCWLAWRHGLLKAGDFGEMLRRLEGLPRAIGDQLRRMGMLDFA
jgi:DNA-binding SARP family transcriptional activator/tetratricopeptide (TPR) repeat protein